MNKKDKFFKRVQLSQKERLNKYASLNLNPILVLQPENVFQLQPNCKILLLREDWIGDVLVSVPTIRALRNKLPDARIDILMSWWNHGAAKAVKKYVNKIWIYTPEVFSTLGLISAVKKEKYDLVVDFYDRTSTTSSLLLKYFRIPIILGIEKENRASYTHVVPLLDKKSVHIVERIANLLLPFGINPEELDLSLEYPVSDDDKKKAEDKMGAKIKQIRLGINLEGTSKSKYWGKENYIRFIRDLLEKHDIVEVYIFTTLMFSGLAKDICKKSGARLAPLSSRVHDYASLLSTCDIVLTPDTAAVHFAAAWKKPCIALYLAESKDAPMPRYPYKSQYKTLTAEADNLSDISVEEAIKAFEELI
jgi:ADP-heptose:LPS heptosyltransferase